MPLLATPARNVKPPHTAGPNVLENRLFIVAQSGNAQFDYHPYRPIFVLRPESMNASGGYGFILLNSTMSASPFPTAA